MQPGNAEALSEAPSVVEAVAVARSIVDTSDMERVEMLHRLRQSLRLSRTVRGLNSLLDRPDYRPLGRQALKCMGLDFGG
jgi:hypothetical protein